jgi:hypothetical protein
MKGSHRRWIIGSVGFALLLFGLGCLNYTKVGSLERHMQVAQERGWPPPSRPIAYMGILFTSLGAGFFAVAAFGRRW